MTTLHLPPLKITNTSNRRSFLLIAAQIAWILLALTMIALFTYAQPYYAEDVNQRVCRHLSPIAAQLNLTNASCIGYGQIMAWISLIGNFAVAALVFWRRGHQWIGLITATTQLTIGFYAITAANVLAIARPEFFPIVQGIFVVCAAIVATFFCTFPDGRFVPRFSAIVPVIVFFIILTISLVLPPSELATTNLPLGIFYLSVIFIIGLMQYYRYRRVATPQQRQQTKVIVFAGLVGIPIWIGSFLLTRIAQDQLILAPTSLGWAAFFMVMITVRYLIILLFAVSFTVSIFRYRLWEIDLVINRALVAGGLTSFLVIVFFAVLVAVQQIIIMLVGGQQSSLAVAGAALFVALLFNPSRKRLQTYVDRRFYPKHLARIDAIAKNQPRKHDTHSGHLDVSVIPGKSFGIYHALEPIGQGGMAQIYKGKQSTINRQVAIKILVKQDRDEYVTRFEREAKVISELHHPNIVQLYDYGEMNGRYYMVMEYIEGQDLLSHLKVRERLSLREALPILQEIASALDHAHAHGLVHRDVKPSNILLDRKPISPDTQYRAVLTDFGIAKILTEKSQTFGDSVIGTLDYIAPEQITSAQNIDHRADIYSLGVMTYEMLTGKVPFEGDNIGALLLAHLQRRPEDPRRYNPNLSERTARGILRALEKEPLARPSNAASFVSALMV